jgi:GH25 family lysozyme M1 (1,4-beta-N-acetylmuramidase)
LSTTIIDVSNVNGPVDWAAVRRAGIEGAFIKATEGLTYNDGLFTTFRNAAAKSGVRIGAYHFARPDNHPFGAESEAEHFCKVVKSLARTDLKPVLDFEKDAPGLTDPQKVAWARTFNRTVKKRLGVIPIFYSYAAFINSLGATTPIGNGLWLAAYGKNDGKEYPVAAPPPWEKVVAHQFTSRGKLAGHAGYVDLSHAASIRPLLAHPILGV